MEKIKVICPHCNKELLAQITVEKDNTGCNEVKQTVSSKSEVKEEQMKDNETNEYSNMQHEKLQKNEKGSYYFVGPSNKKYFIATRYGLQFFTYKKNGDVFDREYCKIKFKDLEEMYNYIFSSH